MTEKSSDFNEKPQDVLVGELLRNTEEDSLKEDSLKEDALKEDDLEEDVSKEDATNSIWPNIKPGMTVDGFEVTDVLASNKHSIVYSTADKSLCWRTKNGNSESQDHAQITYKTLVNKIRYLANKSMHDDLEFFLTNSFASAYMDKKRSCQDVDKIFESVIDMIDKCEKSITKVYIWEDNYQLYLDENSEIQFKFNKEFDISIELSICLNKANIFQNLSKHMLAKDELQIATDYIAIAIQHSIRLFLMGAIPKPDVIFEDVQAFLDARFEANQRVKFLISSVVFASFTGLIFMCFYHEFESLRIYYQAMLCALAGSFVSILQRHNKMVVNANMSPTGMFVEAASKICIGVIFGLFTVFVAQSELALATFKSTPTALFVFTFIAGFSERFAPDMFASISSSNRLEKAAKSKINLN